MSRGPPTKGSLPPTGQAVGPFALRSFPLGTPMVMQYYQIKQSDLKKYISSLDSPEILKDVSFEIAPGERVGVGQYHSSLNFTIYN